MGDSPETRSRYPIRRLVVVGVLAAVVLTYAVYRWSCSRRVEQALDTVRAQGFPADLEELNAWYVEPPPGENAADVLALAFEEYVEAPPALAEHLPIEGDAELPERTEPLREGMKKAIAHHLKMNADALELLRQGAAMPECRWPVDFSRGSSTEFRYLDEIRNCVRLLMLEATYKAEQGDEEGASEAAQTAIRVARTLDKDPETEAQLVRVVCLSLSVSAVENVLNRGALDDTQLMRMQRVLEEAEASDDFVRGLVGERCVWADFMLRPKAWNPIGATPFQVWLTNAHGRHCRETAVYLEAIRPLIGAAQAPLDERLHQVHRVPVPENTDTDVLNDSSPSLIMLPSLARAVTASIRGGAQLRVARTALAIERYRLVHGRLPEALDELLPECLEEVPKDPFGDGPVKYKRLETGYVVYSIGHDEEDDGGLEHDPEGHRRDFFEADLTFTVER